MIVVEKIKSAFGGFRYSVKVDGRETLLTAGECEASKRTVLEHIAQHL